MNFGYKELWHPEAENNLSMFSQMLWPSARMNRWGGRLQNLTLKWPQNDHSDSYRLNYLF